MNKLGKLTCVLLVTLALGCGAAWDQMSPSQQAQFHFNTMDLAFVTAEGILTMFESGGVENIELGRNALEIIKKAIVIYLKQLELLGIIDVPLYAQERIDEINDIAVGLGVVNEDEARLLPDKKVEIALRVIREQTAIGLLRTVAELKLPTG